MFKISLIRNAATKDTDKNVFGSQKKKKKMGGEDFFPIHLNQLIEILILEQLPINTDQIILNMAQKDPLQFNLPSTITVDF